MQDLKKLSYFVLYDNEDFPICYFDGLDDLLLHINYNKYELVRKFKQFGNEIRIVIENKLYKLYKFEN